MSPESLRLEVPQAAAGERLDQFLAGPLGSRARAQRLIEQGAVTVDGRPRAKRFALTAGVEVVVEEARAGAGPGVGGPAGAPAVGEPAGAPALRFGIAWEDQHLLVVDKPAGLVVHPARGHREGTLAQALAGRATGGEDVGRAGIVHRLDRDTSGLLVVALSEEAHRGLRAALGARRIEREYLALVEGRPSARTGTIEAPIGRDRRERTVHSTRTDRPREARTHFEIERSLPRTTLLRVRLETGRTHQIRAHMAAIGHPVCGDRQYGGGPSGDRLVLTRQFLHSAKLRFTHPSTGAPIACESKLPVDLLRALEAAAREPVSEGPDGG